MAAPWEKYQTDNYQKTIGKKPWEKYEGDPEDDSGEFKTKAPAEPLMTGRGLLKSTLEKLPLVGGVGGGLLGSALGPFGSIAGAGVGGTVGKTLENLGEQYLLNEQKTKAQAMLEPITEGVTSAAGEGAGPAIASGLSKGAALVGKGAKGIGSLFGAGTVKEGAEEIGKAASRLGAEATEGMLKTSPHIQALESSLEQSPTLAGSIVRNKKQAVYDVLKKGSEKAVQDATSFTKAEVGSKIKDSIVSGIGEKVAIPQEFYQRFAKEAPMIEIDPKSAMRVAKNIRQHPYAVAVRGSADEALANRLADSLEGNKSLEQLRNLKTYVGRQMQGAESPTQQAILGQAYDSLSRLEQNSVKRNVIKNIGSKYGEMEGKELLGELKKSNALYAKLYEDIGVIKEAGKIKKQMTYNQFIDALEKIPDEQLADKLFKTNDYKSLEKIKKTFPDEFELMRASRLADIEQKSMTKGQMDPSKLLKNVKSLGPESKNLLFGEDSVKVIKDLETVVNSLPPMIGPSGTPKGIEWANYMSPGQWIDELRRMSQLGGLKILSAPANVSKGAETLSKGLLQKGVPGLMGQSMSQDAKGLLIDEVRKDVIEKNQKRMRGE